MSIEAAVMHQLHRIDGQKNIQMQFGETDLSQNDVIMELFLQFKLGFQKRNTRQFGHFDVQSRSNIADVTKLMLEAGSDFIELSHDLAKKLQQFLSETEGELAGYLLFVKERIELKEYFWLFWLEEKKQLQFNSDTMTPEEVSVMDSSRLNMALRIDYDGWFKQNSNKFFTLLVPRGTGEPGQSFANFSAFEQGIDQTEQTKEFLTIVDQYAQTLTPPQAKEYKSKVLDFVVEQDAVGEPVVIEQLAKVVDEQTPEKFSQFVTEKQAEPVAEIQTDRASLKRYMRFSGRDQDMSISFSADRFGEGVTYDASEEALVIKALPKSLKQQLKKFLES